MQLYLIVGGRNLTTGGSRTDKKSGARIPISGG